MKRTFLQVAQKRVFTQQKFVVSEVDGHERVVVPKEVFVGAKSIWEDFLIWKFLNTKAPHVGKIHIIVNKIWRLGDRSSLIDVFEVNDYTVKIHIQNESMRHQILNRGMWNIMDIPMIVSKWTSFAEESQPAMKSIPLWVTLMNVPLSMCTDKGLEFLSSAVGKPIRLHPKTEAYISFDEAQILVKADLTKEFSKEYTFMGDEEGELDSIIKYSYPWLPPRCRCCKKWGHLSATCLSSDSKGIQDRSIFENNLVAAAEKVENTSSPAEPVVVVVDTIKCLKNAGENVEDIIVDTIDCRENAGNNSEDVVKENRKEGWITPKSGRSSPRKIQKRLKYGEVSILSNSYSVLGEDGEPAEETKTVEVDEVTDFVPK